MFNPLFSDMITMSQNRKLVKDDTAFLTTLQEGERSNRLDYGVISLWTANYKPWFHGYLTMVL